MAETNEHPPQPEPEAPVERPRRGHTILGRLAQAIREQNWFAVVLELGIVVLGVVIGFQVTAWGQAQADRAKEQEYLNQLVADLHETEGILTDGDERAENPDRAMRQLYEAFYAPQPPPRDSLLRWIYRTSWIWPVRPVLGTIEALVSTGDLAIIRNDSLRSAITTYLDYARRLTVVHDGNVNRWIEHSDVLFTKVDRATLLEALDPTRTGSQGSAPTWTPVEGERRDPFPYSSEAFLNDREAYAALLAMDDMKNNLAVVRRLLHTRTEALREQVEAELSR